MAQLHPDLMAFRRPDEVNGIIAEKFELSATPNGGGRYEYLGYFSDYFYNVADDSSLLQAGKLIQQVIEQTPAEQLPLHIVDIGTAQGAFLGGLQEYANQGLVTLTGVSAYDYRQEMPPGSLDGITYAVGNAELPNFMQDIDPAALIFSKYCMMHLVDPLGTMEMMLNQLEPGGQLIFDEVELLGVNFDNLARHCNNNGFTVLPDSYAYRSGIECLHVQRELDAASEPLFLPYDYAAAYRLRGLKCEYVYTGS